MRELRHPWLPMHNQDRKSRQRCTKPRRQYELSGATSLLSLKYLFCHTRALLKSHVGSLSPTFVLSFFVGQNDISPAFGFALNGGVLTHLSRTLGPDDIFSSGCRPSQTAHQALSSNLAAQVSATASKEWCYIVAYTSPEREA